MIYFVQNLENGNIKIGHTNCVKERLEVLNSNNDSKLVVLKVLDVDNSLEDLVHFKLDKYHVKGEWFSYNEDVKRFIDNIPTKNSLYVKKYIQFFEFKEDTNMVSPNMQDNCYQLKLKSISARLDTAVAKSKNSGFTDGIRFAQKIIKSHLT